MPAASNSVASDSTSVYCLPMDLAPADPRLSSTRDFRLLLTGQGLSWLGDAFQPIALAVAIVGAGGSANDLGLVLAAGMVARLLCSLWGGVWADRLRPQTVMITADVVRAAAVSGMAVLFTGGHPSLVGLSILSAVLGGAAAFFGPSFVSLRPLLTPTEKRQSANATINLLQSATQVVGPSAGGLLVATAGPVPAFALNAVTFSLSAVTVAFVRAVAVRGERRGMLSELREGWHEIRSRDWLLAGLVSAGVYHVAFGAVFVLAQVVAIRELGGASAVGFIATACGVGGLLGGFLALRAHPRRPLAVGFASIGLLMPVYVLSYVWPALLPVVLLAAAVAFAGLMFFGVVWDTALQDGIPHRVLARVSSWDIMVSFIGVPVGNAVAGPLAQAYGERTVLTYAAVIVGLAGVGPLLVGGVRHKRTPNLEAVTVS